MLLLMLLGAVIFGWLSSSARYRKYLAARCEGRGWQVSYEFSFDENGRSNIKIDRATGDVVLPTPHGPAFLRERFGLAFFNQIHSVSVKLATEEDHDLLKRLATQRSIRVLRIEGDFETRDVQAISGLPNLVKLEIDYAVLSAAEIRNLDELFPDCKIYIRRMAPSSPSKTGPKTGA